MDTPLFSKVIVLSAWAAFGLWVAGEIVRATTQDPARNLARRLWLVGGVVMGLHFLWAFSLRHQWSHESAVAETARQTAAVFGINWGGGVWFNYALLAWWGWDVGESWLAPNQWDRPGARRTVRRSFFWFMWLNGAVIFAPGARKWGALVACLAVLGIWFWEGGRRKRIEPQRHGGAEGSGGI